MTDKRIYWMGVLLTGLGAVVLSPDALLFRLLESDLWTAAFWRLLLMGLTIMGGLMVIRRRRLIGDIRAIGWALAPAAICMAISNLGFVYALTHSTVAETLTILATAPVFAAIFAAFLGERPPLRTWIAALAIAAGIAIILDAGFSGGTSAGNVGALIAAISIAGFFTIGRIRRDCDMTPALGLSSILSAIVCGCMADTLQPADGDWPVLIAVGVFILPIAFTLITLGPRRLPAAEVGMLMLLETALGPLWVWLALEEAPTEATLLGGGLIVAALAAHSLAAWRAERPEAAQVQ
jgi:drug/metabolite transporter (DMT)-like permease